MDGFRRSALVTASSSARASVEASLEAYAPTLELPTVLLGLGLELLHLGPQGLGLDLGGGPGLRLGHEAFLGGHVGPAQRLDLGLLGIEGLGGDQLLLGGCSAPAAARAGVIGAAPRRVSGTPAAGVPVGTTGVEPLGIG